MNCFYINFMEWFWNFTEVLYTSLNYFETYWIIYWYVNMEKVPPLTFAQIY